MTKDDFLPNTAHMAPPDSNDEADQRVAKFIEANPCGLVGCVFLDVEQLRRALWSQGWAMTPKVICDGGRVKTYKAPIENKDKSQYTLILNEVGLSHCEVINCRLVSAGEDVDPADLKAFNDAMEI